MPSPHGDSGRRITGSAPALCQHGASARRCARSWGSAIVRASH